MGLGKFHRDKLVSDDRLIRPLTKAARRVARESDTFVGDLAEDVIAVTGELPLDTHTNDSH